ncbi:MAG TPA: EAL domain-containing protein [Gallionellaceae bacterium]|nr:EAL domain-containing protein [Gallionellaceae bacterium]
MAVFILSLTIEVTWGSYVDYLAVRDITQANSMADALIEAAGIEAVERGLVSSALGDPVRASAETRQAIAELRSKGDARWKTALGAAHALAIRLPRNPEFKDAILHAEQEYAVLALARNKVDACLAGDACNYSAKAWLSDITHFLSDISQLREAVFLPLDSPQHISQLNLALKRWVWMASEHAGRERGTLGYYISARLPLPTNVLDEMKANRGVVERCLFDINSVAELKNTDPRIIAAVQTMKQTYLGRFDELRHQVYLEAQTGRYSLSGGQWMENSTTAINSLLSVAAAVSLMTDDLSSQSMHDAKAHLLRHAIGLAITILLVLLSLTKVRQAADSLFKQKELAEVTLHSIGDAVITTDGNARVEYLNPVAEQITGWKTQQAHGMPLSEVCVLIDGVTRMPEPNPVERCLREQQVVGLASNVHLLARDGKEYIIEDSAAPIRDREGVIVGAVMVFYDVTQMRNTPHLLSYHATHDALTGLVNRREFERRLAELLVRARTLGQHHAFCYIDLDQFKVINDTCGHAVGDKLLRQLTFLLQESMREADTLARLGGDEFGVLLESCPLERAMEIAENLRKIIEEFRFSWEGHPFDLGASIGLVMIDADSVSIEELMSEADAACYAAKEKGRNRVQIFRPDNLELAQRHGEMQWVSRISHALEDNRFVLYCQTIAPLDETLERHCEILLRLRDEEGKLVPPMDFIPAAERYNLMPAIDRWVIQNSLAEIGQHLRAKPGCPDEVFSINLSGASLGEENLDLFIIDQLALHQVLPHLICFEITETAAVGNLDQAATLIKTLKAKGCRFALDDFGSGLSSFRYLKLLPVDYLKIDGAFVKDMVDDPVDYAMVQAINTVGHVMGIKTIAEYVENDAILKKLRVLGVDFAQGYGIRKPCPLTDCFAGLCHKT